MNIPKNKIKKAGNILKNKENFKKEEVIEAIETLTYWRKIHGKVLNEFYKIVNEEALKINKNSNVVQRVKRSPSIVAKLKRHSSTKLTTMQDIAGIRAIMSNLREVELLNEQLKKVAQKHEFKTYDNYIKDPKESGYRSIHLVYKYKNENDLETDGLLLEIQIRTELQHSWATSVETMSTFLDTNLKFGEGQPKWLKYFALTSNAFTYLENTPQLSSYLNLDKKETYRQAIYEFNYNMIEHNLKAFTVAADYITEKKSEDKFYHLIKLDIDNKNVNVTSYKKEEFEIANEQYTVFEKKYSKTNKFEVVLVSTKSINELKSGFPNYFFDTREFLKNMEIIKTEYNLIK